MNTAQSFTEGQYTGWVEGAFTWPAVPNVAQWSDDIRKHCEAEDAAERDDLICKILSVGVPLSARDIRAHTELGPEAINAAMRRLLQAGKVERANSRRPYLWRLL